MSKVKKTSGVLENEEPDDLFSINLEQIRKIQHMEKELSYWKDKVSAKLQTINE